MTPLLLAAALAAEPEVSLHGDVKSFLVATFPYGGWILPEDPSGQGLAAGRLKLEAAAGRFQFEVHHETAALTGSPLSLSTAQTGVAAAAPEAVDLSWTAFDQDLVLKGRIDRLKLSATVGPAELAIGRQAISFGSGLFFTPLDLVNPFTPATIDQEYKPGVDALRADLYPTPSARFALVGAYAGDWDLEGSVLAAWGQGTIGVTDLGGFAGLVRGDPVLGASVVTSVGPVGLNGDAAVTLAEEPFVRAVVGAIGRPGPDTSLSGELYLQTLGTTEPEEYFFLASEPQWARGEVWLFGVAYGALAVSHQVTPLVSGSLAVIGNLLDPSAFLSPSLAWSVAENAEVGLGGYVGLGERPGPGPSEVRSEFGTYPATAFLQVKAYF